MRLLITLVVVAVLSWALARPLCSHSMLFYLAAVALAGAGAYLTIAPPAVLPLREVAFVVQKGYVAFALFAVVMMMGVLDKRSAVRRRLQPVRAQLSLLGTILIAGHIGFYAVVYLEILGSVGAVQPLRRCRFHECRGSGGSAGSAGGHLHRRRTATPGRHAVEAPAAARLSVLRAHSRACRLLLGQAGAGWFCGRLPQPGRVRSAARDLRCSPRSPSLGRPPRLRAGRQ